METKITLDENKVRADFQVIVGELDRWGAFVDRVLNDYVKTCFPSKEHLQFEAHHRVKDIDSYCEKVILRYPSPNPLLDTTDKVGTRVVLLTKTDVEKVSDFVSSCPDWTVVKRTRDTEHDKYLDPAVFTYQSEHFIIMPLASYATTVDRECLTCEIQIRTILQHAYAEISHDTVYKRSVLSNNVAKRKLASAMAFIEATDEKFIEVYQDMEDTSNFFAAFQDLLVNIYRQFVPDYDNAKYDVEVAAIMLSIYSMDELTAINKEIEAFCNEPQYELSSVIPAYSQKCQLFKHPVVLVALYGMINLQSTTWSSWPFTYDTVKYVLMALNMSVGSLK